MNDMQCENCGKPRNTHQWESDGEGGEFYVCENEAPFEPIARPCDICHGIEKHVPQCPRAEVTA